MEARWRGPVLVVGGLTVLVGLRSPLRTLIASTAGVVAFVIVAGAWVGACVFLAFQATDAGRLEPDTPVARRRSVPDPPPAEPTAHGHVVGCPGCQEVMIAGPGRPPAPTWSCQARYGMPQW
jgi:hypothetical protein